jgi:acetyl-CoA carboxylase carboxyltransferase component
MSGGGSVKTIEMAGRTYIPELAGWDTVIDHLDVAPSVSLVLGSVAGMGAARATTCHYSVMVRDTSQMMIAGPALVEQAGLGSVSKEELGHADIHTRNGSIDDAVDTEQEAFERALHFLSYLPSSVDELPPVENWGDDPGRREEWLIDAIPTEARQAYDMRAIIAAVVDRGTFLEMGRDWGTSIIAGLARLDGVPVVVYAEDPRIYGGGWTADACRKLIRMADLASLFQLPIVHLEDCPGFVIGKTSEEEGTIRLGSTALVALRQARVPYFTVVVRRAFGVAGASNRKPGATSMRAAWPSGDWGSLPLEGGLEVAYKAELADADDPDTLRSEIAERLNRLRSPHRSAEFYEIEQIIDPRDTRPMLCDWVHLARRTLTPGPPAWGFRP